MKITVRIRTPYFIVDIVGIFFMILFLVCNKRLLFNDLNSGNKMFSIVFPVIVIIVLIVGIIQFVYYAGSSISISGQEITLRRMFFYTRVISIDDVYNCAVVYNVIRRVSDGEYGSHIVRYSKATINYVGGKSFTVPDNLYTGWDELIDYMDEHKKTVTSDEHRLTGNIFKDWKLF